MSRKESGREPGVRAVRQWTGVEPSAASSTGLPRTTRACGHASRRARAMNVRSRLGSSWAMTGASRRNSGRRSRRTAVRTGPRARRRLRLPQASAVTHSTAGPALRPNPAARRRGASWGSQSSRCVLLGRGAGCWGDVVDRLEAGAGRSRSVAQSVRLGGQAHPVQPGRVIDGRAVVVAEIRAEAQRVTHLGMPVEVLQTAGQYRTAGTATAVPVSARRCGSRPQPAVRRPAARRRCLPG